MRRRNLAVAALVALTITAATAHPVFDSLRHQSIDVLFWLRHVVYGPLHTSASSPAVIVAVDEETYQRPPFVGLPKVMWTPQFSVVIEALLNAGVKVIGQDLVLPTSVEQYITGFDRDYLRSLRKGGMEGRVVLSRMQIQDRVISPSVGQRIAVGKGRNVRLINLYRDTDGVIRRVPLMFRVATSGGEPEFEPSMALELASRAVGSPPVRAPNGAVTVDGYAIPGSTANSMLLNFDSGPRSIPIFSFADLYACAKSDKRDFFQEHFNSKVVLFGAVLDVEDRKITSKRFIESPESERATERCVLPAPELETGNSLARKSSPGVLVHATAVNNILRRDALSQLPVQMDWLIGLCFAAVSALGAIWLRPIWLGAAFIACAAIWAGVATTLFQAGLVLPLYNPLVAGGATAGVLLAYRLTVTDRTARRIRRAFGKILAPSLVEKMVQTGQMPAQGGELRLVTVWIADLQNYTAVAEILAPQELVSLLNEIYTVMSDTIEEYNGFVAQFAGDAVVAAFGVPLKDHDHARHGVEAAMACVARVAGLRAHPSLPVGFELRIRVGVGTGELLVGYIGSRRRLNYAVVGDAINLSSRLEGVNKIFGSSILVDEQTRELCGPCVAFREVDVVRVKGRDQPVQISEPIGKAASIDPKQRQDLADFAEGLGEYRRRRFLEAAAIFDALADRDPVSRSYAERCRAMHLNPPAADWDGVNTLTVK